MPYRSRNVCISIVLLFPMLVAGLAMHGVASEPDALLFAGREAWKEGDFTGAIELFAGALEGYRARGDAHGEAESLQGLGLCYEDLGQFEIARDYYQASLEIFERLDDMAAQGDCHVCLGWTHLGLGLPAEAFRHFELAYAIFTDLFDLQGEQSSLTGLAEAVTRLASQSDERGEAVGNQAYYRTAIDYLKGARVFHSLTGDLSGEAYCCFHLARCHEAIGDDEATLSSYEEALRLFREANDPNGEMQVLDHIAALHESRDEWEQAIEAFEQTRVLACSLEDRQREAEVLLCITNCLISLGRFEEALTRVEEAQAVFRALLDERGEIECLRALARCYRSMGDALKAAAAQREAAERAGRLGDRLLRADLLCELAELYMVTAEFQEAIDTLEGAFEIYEAESDPRGVACTLVMLGDCYQMLGAFDRAMEYFESAREIAAASGCRAEEASSLRGIGVCQQLWLGNVSLALSYYQQALSVFQSVRGEESGEAWCRFHAATCLLEQGVPLEAIAETETALEMFRRRNEQMGVLACLQTLGNCSWSIRQRQSTREYFEEALAVAEEIEAAHEAWNLSWALGSLLRELGDRESARTYYERALVGAESILGELRIEGLIRSYLARIIDVYAEYLALLLETGDVADTLPIAERCRARTFLDSISKSAEISLLPLPERGIQTGVVNAAVIDADLKEAVAMLPEETAVLEYFATRDRLYVWVIRDNAIGSPHTIRISRSSLQTQVIQFRQLLEAAQGGLQELPGEAFHSASRALFQLLIAPVVAELEGIAHLVLVPSGPLYYLPFAALLDCPSCVGIDYLSGSYLAEEYSLSYVPSLATLKHAWLMSVATQPAGFLALADPDSGDPTIQRLPEAEEEARAIHEILGAGEIHVGEHAIEDLLDTRGRHVAYLLISSHGRFDAANPMYSYLQLAPSAGSDGKLHTYEVFELSLSTSLVTLSACETLLPALADAEAAVRAERGLTEAEPVELDDETLTELTTGDEIVGLTRAFIYAGSPSVLSTLWKVASEPTKQLMVAFYTRLVSGLDKAQALRQAQLDVMAFYPHPRYWAAFSLVGDWR